jgi:antitoxin component YwqK of YwqJK toxin-antitoxin module
MEAKWTCYGKLDGISSCEFYANGNMKGCMLQDRVEITTKHGVFIPQYQFDSLRKKHINSLTFYEDGSIKSIYLNRQSYVNTAIGMIPAEFITFYKSGCIKRIFPLNGQISAYWEENDELELADDLEFIFQFGSFKAKVIGLYFYEDGAIKGLTLWPNETVSIQTPIGEYISKMGISLYPDGSIKSFEPAFPIPLVTSIGLVEAYDINAIGINGDRNSVSFDNDGKLKSLITSTDKITVVEACGNKVTHLPLLKESLLEEGKMDIIPVRISFDNDMVDISGKSIGRYEIGRCSFRIGTHLRLNSNKCKGCLNCDICSASGVAFV